MGSLQLLQLLTLTFAHPQGDDDRKHSKRSYEGHRAILRVRRHPNELFVVPDRVAAANVMLESPSAPRLPAHTSAAFEVADLRSKGVLGAPGVVFLNAPTCDSTLTHALTEQLSTLPAHSIVIR